MTHIIKTMLLAGIICSPTTSIYAEDIEGREVIDDEPVKEVKADISSESVMTPDDEASESGFFTSIINREMEKAMSNTSLAAAPPDGTPVLGRKLTDYVTAPKFGGYIIEKYAYTDKEGAKGGDGFNLRLVRLYLDGSILTDFKYRVQLQVNGMPGSNTGARIVDAYMEWAKYKEFSVKLGQFKRAFTFENPYNPWDVGAGDYALAVNKLAGLTADYNGAIPSGGRDQGIQLQGDLFPSKADGHRYLHYQLAAYNGQGINQADKNGKKDLIGTIQVQPVKNLYIGLFGWNGSYTNGALTLDRNRYAAGVKYESDWTFRAEYIHSQGHKESEYNAADGSFSGTGKADGWYATAGVPCNNWLKLYVKYDAYRDQATWGSLHTIYTICPNIQIHKNLMLQLQYNYNYDKTSADKKYSQLWAEAYIRF